MVDEDWLETEEEDEAPANHFVGDLETFKTRLLSRKCPTCIFRPGNPVLSREACEAMAQKALGRDAFIPCHSTYSPLWAQEGMQAAVCRGFYDVHKQDSSVIKIMEHMFGFIEVELPTSKEKGKCRQQDSRYRRLLYRRRRGSHRKAWRK